MDLRCPSFRFVALALLALLPVGLFAAAGAPLPRSVSGIYPHLATFNQENECGTGAVVPWADRLWVISYAPHMPKGSSDKLYEIDRSLRQTIRPESIGGTPANRFIHRESQQLFIGPYAIDAERHVRAIPYRVMFGRPTGNARHLTDPARLLYYATMEEGLYEVDVQTLAVTPLWIDEQIKTGRHANLPGYHGKGLFSGQGRVVYANNGEHGAKALVDPTIPSGVLAEWDGRAAAWTVIRRNQFTEVTGPGGLFGNENVDTEPLWSVGWDHRSLLLLVLDHGRWHSYRLPKASHAYDGAHGWNTEWPRIREIGEGDRLLMTMHGMFWQFPRTFTATSSAGIAPRSTYLKVIGDFCRWDDRVVFGCDDAAKSEFLNQRRTKGAIAGPGQSQSNLWFVAPEAIDHFGPPLGRGAVWLDEPVPAGADSDPFLFSGFDRRGLHLAHRATHPVTFALEVDRSGTGQWTPLRTVTVPAGGYIWTEFSARETGAWIRLRPDRAAPGVTAFFHFRQEDRRPRDAATRFAALARPNDASVLGGLTRALGDNRRTLGLAATQGAAGSGGPSALGYYELDAALHLRRVDQPEAAARLQQQVALPRDVLTVDAASVLLVDDGGRRWRLPKGDAAFDTAGALGAERIDREVCTERDLLNVHGTFYELPAENAGGFAKLRPIATHHRRIHDYCSYRGLLILTGLRADAPPDEHVVRSDDGRAALWAGTIDDLWALGKPRGRGGPWHHTAVRADQPSDPYLFCGYDRRSVRLAHDAGTAVRLRLEVDVAGTGLWLPWQTITVPAGQARDYEFPAAFEAYWIRVVADTDCRATAWFTYE